MTSTLPKYLEHILVNPHITEKGTKASVDSQYLFKVHITATKRQIQKAVEAGFNVKVAAVNTVNMSGKERRFGKTIGRRSDWKKAYVTLMQGYTINFSEPESVKD